MITTNASYLKPNFFRSESQSLYNWRCVDLELNFPYYFVEYAQTEGYAKLTTRKIVANFSDLEEVCKAIQENMNLELTQVSLLSPGWLNKTTGWELNALSEIQYGNFGKKDPWVQIFILQDGRRLIDSSLDLKLEDAIEMQCHFSVKAYM